MNKAIGTNIIRFKTRVEADNAIKAIGKTGRHGFSAFAQSAAALYK